MGGIALLFHRDGSPARPAVLDGMLQTLRHRGPDGYGVSTLDGFGMGYQSFWTTPEEVGERQPLCGGSSRYLLVFDGRLDNREVLLRDLDVPPGDAAISDAELALRAYQRWGESCFPRFLGPFAMVVHDAAEHMVVCARDPLGDRTLFYHLDEHRLVGGSEEQAVLAHPQVSPELDDRGIAHYFALETPADGGTLFRDVKQLPAAHALAVGPEGVRLWRFWRPRRQTEWGRADDEECAEQFRRLLNESVKCRLRAVGRPAVLMSGGLDSTSVAALAARHLSTTGSGPLRTVSWIFDELTECDERPWIQAMVGACGLDPLWVRGDDLWPLSPGGEWPRNPNTPDASCFRALRQRAYATAREVEARVVLNGTYGDELQGGQAEWLADLVLGGRLGDAVRQFGAHLRHGGARMVTAPCTRRLVARALPRPLVGRRQRGRVPEWLLSSVVPTIDWPSPVAAEPFHLRRYDQYISLLSPWAACGPSYESYYAALHGVELRRPYRDRRLVEFMLSVPASQFYRMGWNKYIARNAMRGVLPDSVRVRTHFTDLTPLYVRGTVERETEPVRALLGRPGAVWKRFVRADWMDSMLNPQPRPPATRREHAAHAALWQCISFELWRSEGSESNAIDPYLASSTDLQEIRI